MSTHKLPGEYVYEGMTLSENIPVECIEEVKSLDLKAGDIVLDAYPKSGEIKILDNY